MKQISITEAQNINLTAGAQIKELLNTYGVEQNGVLVSPPVGAKNYGAWSKKFKAIYNPTITWRPDATLAETSQYAEVS